MIIKIDPNDKRQVQYANYWIEFSKRLKKN
jgi:hypothetical protein